MKSMKQRHRGSGYNEQADRNPRLESKISKMKSSRGAGY